MYQHVDDEDNAVVVVMTHNVYTFHILFSSSLCQFLAMISLKTGIHTDTQIYMHIINAAVSALQLLLV